MMIFLPILMALLFAVSASAQTTQPIRNQFTTNNAMNVAQDGWIAVWNNAAKKWSNTVNVASSTNVPAYLQTATLTNLAGTGLSAGGTNASAYIGSSSGSGTNATLRGTTTSLFASTTTNSGDMGIAGSLLVDNPGVFNDTLDVYSSFQARADSQFAGISTFNSNAVIGAVTFYPSGSSFTTVLSNTANNATHIFGAATYTVTPSILNSNLATGSMFQGAKLYNKTNVTLIAQPGQTIIDGSSALGELLFISNCYNVTIKGFTFRGMTNHNINALPDYSSYLWAGVNLYASARVRFEDCRFERHADHGLQDKGAEANSVGSSTIISTNMIEVLNCYFTDIGGFRTNSGDGTIRGDGTCIVPTGWTMIGNTFENAQRGIEPYDTADADGRLFYNTIIKDNKFYNIVEFAVSPAGSTNGHNVQVIGNTLINDPSFSYHGTNWGAGGIPAVCQGFMLNGGRGWVVKDNYAKGAMYLGFSMISGATLDDFTLEGNTADFIDRGDSLGYGFWIGNSVNSAANASSVRRLTMRGNKTFKTYDSGILVLAARDSVVDGNTVSTILRTNIGVSSSAFQFGAASMGSSIITNLTIQNNVAINGNNDAAQPMDVAFGYAFAANLSNVKSINNHAYDFDIAAYTNLAGDNVRIENSIPSDTNRVMRVRDLNGLLTQGANITLTPAADGSVTIAGSGGAASTNFTTIASGSATIGSISTTNNVTHPGNVVHSGTNIVSGVQRFPTIATNTLLHIGGASNVIGLTLGANLSISGGALVAAGGGSGGTNYPPVIRIGTNIVAGSGVEQDTTIQTNASFGLVISGTPLNGETIGFGVSNINTATIYWTNLSALAMYDPTVASNVTTFAVAGSSIRWFLFKHSTNFNLGTGRWELRSTLGKQMELAAAGDIRFHTNTAGSIVTISNIPPTAAAGGNSAAIQFNQSGSLAGTNQLVYDRTNNRVGIGASAPAWDLEIASSNPHIYLRDTDGSSALLGPNSLDFSNSPVARFTISYNGTEIWNFQDTTLGNAFMPAGTTLTKDIGGASAYTRSNYLGYIENHSTRTKQVFYNIQTPAITTSNILVSFATNNYELIGLTNAVLTNIVELTTGLNAKTKLVIRNTLSASVPIVWPAFGAQHGYYFHTNGFNDILTATVAPPGTNTVVSMEIDGTNVYPTVTYWRHP